MQQGSPEWYSAQLKAGLLKVVRQYYAQRPRDATVVLEVVDALAGASAAVLRGTGPDYPKVLERHISKIRAAVTEAGGPAEIAQKDRLKI